MDLQSGIYAEKKLTEKEWEKLFIKVLQKKIPAGRGCLVKNCEVHEEPHKTL